MSIWQSLVSVDLTYLGIVFRMRFTGYKEWVEVSGKCTYHGACRQPGWGTPHLQWQAWECTVPVELSPACWTCVTCKSNESGNGRRIKGLRNYFQGDKSMAIDRREMASGWCPNDGRLGPHNPRLVAANYLGAGLIYLMKLIPLSTMLGAINTVCQALPHASFKLIISSILNAEQVLYHVPDRWCWKLYHCHSFKAEHCLC